MAYSIVLATALLAACGDDPESTAPGSTASATTVTPPTTPAPTMPATTTTTATSTSTTTTTTTPAPTTTLAPETTVAVDPLLIAPGTIEDGIHVGYLVSQSPGSFAFDRADVAPDGSWSNTNPLVRTLPIATPLSLANGSPIVVVVQSQRVLDASSIVPATAPTVPNPPPLTPAPTAAPTQTPGATRYVVPSPDPGSSWADEHSSYPATDLFVPGGCGGEVVSPVDGTLLDVRRTDGYDPAVDNPATRGGRSISILGDDGVRYYLAHFAEIHPDIAVGRSVEAGQSLGTVGDSGRTSACHIHFGISPPCPAREWAVRRGVIWPFPYLDAWRDGIQRSPVDEVRDWVADNPQACADAARDPNAPDA